MKKNFAFIAIMVTFFALSSCQKVTKDTPSEEGGSQEQVIPDNWVEMTFGLTAEESKVSLSGTKVSFENGDTLTVLWDGGSSNGIVQDGKVTLSADPDATQYFAVYPAGKAELADDNVSLVVTTPATDVTGLFKDACIMVAKAKDGSFSFKHAVGIMEFSFSAPGSNSSKLTLRGNQEESISGSFTVGFDDEGNIDDIDISGATAKTIVTKQIKFEKDVLYYMPVLPGASLLYGFGLQVVVNSGSSSVSGSLTTTPFSFDRGTISSLGNAQKAHDYYFTPGGAGKKNGTDWENAGDESLLVKILGNTITNENGTVTNPGYTNAYRIHNRKLYLSGGTYDLSDNGGSVTANWLGSTTNVKIFGSYDPETNQKDTTNQKTYFTTTAVDAPVITFTGLLRTVEIYDIRFKSLSSTTNYAAAVAFTNTCYTDPSTSYKGVTFTDCYFTDNTGMGNSIVSANFLNSSTTAGRGKINFKRCKFLNNNLTGSNGSCLLLDGKATQAVIDSCEFSGNTGTRPVIHCKYSTKLTFTDTDFSDNECSYPSLYVIGSSSSKVANISISDCNFTNCSSSASNGGGILAQYVTNLTISDTDFKNCTVTQNDGTGGAVYLNYVGSSENRSEISGCTFNGNKVTANTTNTQGGALRAAYSYVDFDNCEFLKNSSTVFGGAVQCASSSDLTFENCSFTENSASMIGGGLYNVTGAVNLTDCSFTSNTANFGGAIGQRGTKDSQCLICTNVTFTSNVSNVSSTTYGGGGAVSNIYTTDGDNGTGPAHFTGCKFIENSSTSYGGAVAVKGKVTYTFDHCVFDGNVGYFGGDIDLDGTSGNITSCYLNGCSSRNYGITGTSNNSKYYSFSINARTQYTDVGVNNCSFGERGTVKTTIGNVICLKGNGVVVNTTIFATGTQLLRFDGLVADSNQNYTINNFLIQPNSDTGNSINQNESSTQYGYYNILGPGKNNYATLAATDVSCVQSKLTSKTWTQDTTGLYYLDWTTNVTIDDEKYANETAVEDLMSTNFANFDTWLKTLATHPYSVDILGNSRTTDKFQKGSYDTGL